MTCFKKTKIVVILIILINIFSFNIYSHSGRTDSSGGHKDNKNVSGLGSYHYHCGRHPAHLHSDGVCPYSTSKTTSTVTSSSDIKTNSKNIVEIESIKIINNNKTQLAVNENLDLKVNILPEDPTNKTINWTSTDNNILKVNENGQVQALKAGTAKIIASSKNGKSDIVSLTVISLPEKVEILNAPLTIDVGSSIKLNTRVTPSDSSYVLIWTSSFPEILKVNNGEVFALKEGQATIYVKTNNDKQNEITINVKNKETTNNRTSNNTGLNIIDYILFILILIGIYLLYKKLKSNKSKKN